MSEKIKGIVEAVSESHGGIKIGETWYNAVKEKQEFVKKELKGAEVELTLDEKGKKFSELTIIKESTEKPKSPQQKNYDDKDDYWVAKGKREIENAPIIIRESALKSSASLYSGLGSDDIDSKFLIEEAKKFEKYIISGDKDDKA